MKISDMLQAVKVLDNEWDLGKRGSKAKGKICAWIYLMEILEETEKMIIYKEENKLIGFCGYEKYDSRKNRLKKKFYHIVKQCLIMSPTIKNKEAIYQYMKDYDYTPKELKNEFDGEISILIVDKEYRGKGIGKKLLLETFEYARKDEITKLQILTDESCNVKFYELCGCKKVYEQNIPNGEPQKCQNVLTEVGYIYEKEL